MPLSREQIDHIRRERDAHQRKQLAHAGRLNRPKKLELSKPAPEERRCLGTLSSFSRNPGAQCTYHAQANGYCGCHQKQREEMDHEVRKSDPQ